MPDVTRPSDRARASLVGRLAAGPDRIARVASLAPDAGATADRWTARQNVAHLARVERLVFQARLDQLAAGGVPSWSWTEPGTSDAPEMATLDGALAAFAAARGETVARVSALDDAGWRRHGLHATYGRLDVAGLLLVIVEHDDEHRADIEALATTGDARSARAPRAGKTQAPRR